jgi:cysteine desulfurase
MAPIYLDYNATTPIDPAVQSAMQPYFHERFGNPSSGHEFGRDAARAIQEARSQIADSIHAKPDEIIFTGGGSEASNLAIKGVAFASPSKAALHFITTAIEHPATLEPMQFLQRLGHEVTIVPVDRFGRVDPDDIRSAITPSTALISVMHSNNEVGTIQPIPEIAKIAHNRGIWIHTDAAQSLGKVAIEVDSLGVDLMTIAGHKLYAPKGVGALYVRGGVKLEPLIHGAGHERGRRAGTENVPSLVGLGAACVIAHERQARSEHEFRVLRDRLWSRLSARLGPRVTLNGHPEERLPNTLNLSFAGWIGAELLASLPAIAASTGSACHNGAVAASPVLRAMGVEPEIARGAVRLSVGRYTTFEDVDLVADALIERVNQRCSGRN